MPAPLPSPSELLQRIAQLEGELKQLRHSEERYRGIIENMELGILEVDNQERVVKAHPKFCALVGYTEEELLGHKASSVLLPPGSKAAMEAQILARKRGQSGLYETTIRHKSGETKWLLISGVPISNADGEVVGSMGIHYDITSRKQDELALIQAKKEADDARMAERRFMANISHEIRTPLTAIIGMNALLRDEAGLTVTQMQLVESMGKAGGLLKDLLDNVIDISRLEEGEMPLHVGPTDVDALWSDLAETFKPLLQEKGLYLNVEGAGMNGRLLSLDGAKLRQILVNLVGNAMKFTDEGGITLRHQWMAEGPETGQLILEIEDTGIGIPEVDLDRVFERFQQASNRRFAHRGSGLGLAIVDQMCRRMGGEVRLDSRLGKGSRFTVQLPAKMAKLPEARARKASLDFGSLRILLAEDEAVNAFFIQSLLRRWGSEVVHVRDGAAAIEAWQSSAFDLVLMDVQMPGCNGLEAARIMKAGSASASKTCCILGLSAFASEEDVAQALASGMDGHLAKPFLPEQLRQACQRVLT